MCTDFFPCHYSSAIQYNNYLHTICIVLGIISKVEMTYCLSEDVCRFGANTIPRYKMDSNSFRFWYMCGSWNQSSKDAKRQLYNLLFIWLDLWFILNLDGQAPIKWGGNLGPQLPLFSPCSVALQTTHSVNVLSSRNLLSPNTGMAWSLVSSISFSETRCLLTYLRLWFLSPTQQSLPILFCFTPLCTSY
jgi:hypothetical protein